MTADTILNSFFSVVKKNAAHHGDVDHLMKKVFCADTGKFPCVGITDHGPQFIGGKKVRVLFDKLFHTFPDMALTPFGPRTYSKGAPTKSKPRTIGVQTTLSGTHRGHWFLKEEYREHYSPPLSDMPPAGKKLTLPAACFFTLDGANRVKQISIYFDRYEMQRQLKSD